MVAITYLFTCALAVAQPGDRGEWLLLPRLNRGQELVYRGTFAEEYAVGKGVQFNRNYRLETRIFVLETPPTGADLAFLTVLKQQVAGTERTAQPEPCSVRLERATMDLQGHLQPLPGGSLTVPLDGPPTIECGAILELPHGQVSLGKRWSLLDLGRPTISWQAAGTEVINGTSCLKLIGTQQSEYWDRPRADGSAWRLRETVWLALRVGVAYRVERTIELREAGHEDPARRSVARYELASSLQYPGQLAEDRRQEISLALELYRVAAPMLPDPGKWGTQPFDKLLARINYHLENHSPTPYRDAVLQIRRRIEAARRGESPPPPRSGEVAGPVSVATIGQPAPDFLVPDVVTRDSVSLRSWQGQPVLLVFYSPQSLTAQDVLRFAESVAEKYRERVAVVGLAVSDDTGSVRRQSADLGLSFPILSGKGLRLLYAVDATPKLILLDAAGIVRAMYVGWGRETAQGMTEEVQHWLPRQDTPRVHGSGN